MAEAQEEGLAASQLEPGDLVFFLIALAAWCHAVPQMARMLTGHQGDDTREQARRRAAVVRPARQLALPPQS